MSGRPSCGNDSNSRATLHIHHGNYESADHARRKEPILTLFLREILLDECEYIIEDTLRLLKTDFMLPEIGFCLGLIPLEVGIDHVIDTMSVYNPDPLAPLYPVRLHVKCRDTGAPAILKL